MTNAAPKPGIVFLEEDVVDVFVSETSQDGIELDEMRTEGLLFSLMESKSINRTRSVLRMLSTQSFRTSRAVRVLPCVRVVRSVAWQDAAHKDPESTGMRHVTDAAYLGEIRHLMAAKDMAHSKVVESLERAMQPYGITSTSKAHGSFDARVDGAYAHNVRIMDGEPVDVTSILVSMRFARQQSQFTKSIPEFDTQSYLRSLSTLKPGDTVACYASQVREAVFSATVVEASAGVLVLRLPDESTVTVWTERHGKSAHVFPFTINTSLPPMPFKMALKGSDVPWHAALGWAIPMASTIVRERGEVSRHPMSPQALLDRSGWGEHTSLTFEEWRRLASSLSLSVKTKRNLQLIAQRPSRVLPVDAAVQRWVDAGAYASTPMPAATLSEAWDVGHRPDTGLLVLLGAMDSTTNTPTTSRSQSGGGGGVKTNDKDCRPYDIGTSGCKAMMKQTPRCIVGRLASFAGSDRDIRECDMISFADFGGLSDIVIRLHADESIADIIGSRLLAWHGMYVPPPGCVAAARLKHVTQHRIEESDSGTRAPLDLLRQSTKIVTFLKLLKGASRRSTSVLPVRLQLRVPISDDSLETSEFQLSVDDGQYYGLYASPSPNKENEKEKEKGKSSEEEWDYANLLRLLCVATGVTLSRKVTSFIVNNAAFANPVEIYMRRLRHAVQMLKSRRQQNLSQWQGGVKAYQLHEDRMISNMRRDTLAIFCARTLACYSALLDLGCEQGVIPRISFACAAEGLSSGFACASADIMRDGLGLPFDPAVFAKVMYMYATTFRQEGKLIPATGADVAVTLSATRSNLRVHEPWTGFRPSAHSSNAMLVELERIARSAPIEGRNNNNLLRCCMARSADVASYFAANVALASISEREAAAAHQAQAAWTADVKPSALWVMPQGSKRPTANRAQPKSPLISMSYPIPVERHSWMGVGDADAVSSELDRWCAANAPGAVPSEGQNVRTWARNALLSARTALNSLAARIVKGALHVGSDLVPPGHASQEDVATRHVITYRFLRSVLPSVFNKHGVAVPVVQGLTALEPQGGTPDDVLLTFARTVAILASQLLSVEVAHPKLVRSALEELRARLDFNIINEDDLRRSLQKQREEEKMAKLQAAGNLTEEQREILQEWRKFKRMSWEEVVNHVQGTGHHDFIEDGDAGKDMDMRGSILIDRRGLGAMDRDADASNDDVDYGE